MFKKLTYKQLIRFLPVIFVLTIILIYWLALSETITLKYKCKELAEEISNAKDAPKQLFSIRNKLEDLNKIMGKDTLNSDTDPLLRFLTDSEPNSINLIDLQPLHVFQHQNYQITTRVAVFEGRFIDLTKFLYHLEKDFNAGKPVSIKYQSETNYKTGKKRLLMTLLIQSVKTGVENQESVSIQTK